MVDERDRERKEEIKREIERYIYRYREIAYKNWTTFAPPPFTNRNNLKHKTKYDPVKTPGQRRTKFTDIEYDM